MGCFNLLLKSNVETPMALTEIPIYSHVLLKEEPSLICFPFWFIEHILKPAYYSITSVDY